MYQTCQLVCTYFNSPRVMIKPPQNWPLNNSVTFQLYCRMFKSYKDVNIRLFVCTFDTPMKVITYFFILFCFAINNHAQKLINGSFEDNTAPMYTYSSMDTMEFKNIKLIRPNVGLIRRGVGYSKNTNPNPGSPGGNTWSWVPDGTTYLFFFPGTGTL